MDIRQTWKQSDEVVSSPLGVVSRLRHYGPGLQTGFIYCKAHHYIDGGMAPSATQVTPKSLLDVAMVISAEAMLSSILLVAFVGKYTKRK